MLKMKEFAILFWSHPQYIAQYKHQSLIVQGMRKQGGTGQKARGVGEKGERASDKFYFAQRGVKVATLDGGVWGAERAVVPPINQFHAQHCVCPDFSC